VLFGGKLVVDHVQSTVTIDGWLVLPVAARTAVIMKELRLQLEQLLRNKVQFPRTDLRFVCCSGKRGVARERLWSFAGNARMNLC
jgi:hypothetical protein